MIKILLIQETASNYRAPIYSLIGKECDFTVGYTHNNNIEGCVDFSIVNLPYLKIGPICIIRHLIKMTRDYDVIIIPPHLKFVASNLLPFIKTKCKIITWTIGLHITYNRKLDLSKAPSFVDKLTYLIISHSDAAIFYMPETIDYWKRYRNINEEKCFVAHNTVEIDSIESIPVLNQRKSFLFVGTLYKQKGLQELIDAYKLASEKIGLINMPLLNIIGGGPEKSLIEEVVKDYGLQGKLIMHGPIYDEKILAEYFLDAIISISPKQAGLSVLKSLGYGVPFVTHPDAITGGEIFNIVNEFNGLFYSSTEELAEILIKAANKDRMFEQLSMNARDTYIKNCSPENMAKGVLDAINYAINGLKKSN